GQHESCRIDRLGDKRTRRLDHYLHTASRRIIDLLVREGIGTLVIGKNPHWKQQINIGKRNNQSFVAVPHARFVDMLVYKAELVGIRVALSEESYTSKTSFLDWEPPYKQEAYAGRRVTRGLFQASDGRIINADVNGAYQIIRKAFPDALGLRDRGLVVGPMPLGRRSPLCVN
ncbi:MAG: IS200/IS605 family accessory protein TnpB-related protein, partial [Chloroflexi bacterium]|nr:IS200/IS605 family accessory protein TnpB-related protein [Chloroflexota bacterium]